MNRQCPPKKQKPQIRLPSLANWISTRRKDIANTDINREKNCEKNGKCIASIKV